MKKLTHLTLLVLLAAWLPACIFPGYKIKPGDKLGGMQFINDDEACPGPNFSDICGFPALADGTCLIPASTPVFWISTGWVEATQAELESTWKDSTWKLTFDGHELDLAKFGTYDMELDGQKARIWEVCISNPPEGKHNVYYEYEFIHGVHLGKWFSDLTFTVEPASVAPLP